MEVEDRHLNIMVDLINKLVNCGEPLMYLSENFNPTDIVYRLAQLIILYGNNVLSESPFLPILQKDPNSEPNYCLTIGSIVKLWLLDFYKQEFVTLNKLEVESGFEEEIVLTTLMVLRVLYQMRQLMEHNIRKIMTEEWKDLHEFDQQLDHKFDMKCLKLMSLLVKHSLNFNLRSNALLKQIDGLKEQNKCLTEKITSFELNINSIPQPLNDLSQRSITTIEVSMDTSVNEVNEVQPNMSPSNAQMNGSKESIENHIKLVTKTPLKRENSPKKSPMSPKTSPVKRSDKSENKSVTTSSAVPKLRSSPSAKQKSPSKPNKAQPPESTRRSPRTSKILSKSNPRTTAQKAFREIRALFSESDDSESENVDKRPTKTQNKVTKPLKPIPIVPEITITPIKPLHEPIPSIPLPFKKRKSKFLCPPPIDEVLVPEVTDEKIEAKSKKPKIWPSRSKNYPRKKRYPCNYVNCSYIADRPSTLVRHCRAHTGEKPFACDFPNCDKRYKMSSNLTPHKLTHAGVKPYGCDYSGCDKRFTYPQHLKRHRLSHIKRDRHQKTKQISNTVTDSSKRLKHKLIAITST